MANTRSVIAPGVFANDALTTIPPAPVQGVAYRNPAISIDDSERGWPYAVPPMSDVFNEIMFRVTSLMSIMDGRGILGWTNLKDYTAGALQMGSDGELYQALQASGPSTTPQDPVSSVLYWARMGTPPGSFLWHAASTPPSGYLVCGQSPVSRTVYARLFAVIGTTWGAGDGSTTFNLPDGRGEFMRGWDNTRGVDPGRVFGVTQLDELKAHTHTVFRTDGADQTVNSNGSNAGTGFGYQSGSTGGAETRPRNITGLLCIKF